MLHMYQKERADMDQKTIKVYSAALLFSFLVGFSFIGVKSITSIGSTLEILAFRYDFAFLATLFVLLARKKGFRIPAGNRRDLILTAAFYILFMILQAAGLVYTTSIVSGIIFALIPIIAKIIAEIFLKERSTWVQNGFVLLSVGSLIVMIIKDAAVIDANIGGILLLLLSSTCMAISNVFMRYVRRSFSPLEISFAITFSGFVIFNLATLISGIGDQSLSHTLRLFGNPLFVLSTAYLGIFCTLVTAFLASYMLANLEAVKATMFGNLSTAISLIAGVVVLKEPLHPYHILCTVLIIIGVAGVSIAGKKPIRLKG